MANFRQTPNAENIPIEIVGSSTFGRYPKQSSAMTQNMFISDDWLINFSGYKKTLAPLEASRGRGLFHSIRGNILIAVYGSGVYRIDSNFNQILIGHLATESGEVFMDENLNNQIAIVDGLNLYITNHTLPPNLTVQSGGPLGSNLIPNYVKFHDTFFLIGNANTTNNGAQWYAYSYATDTTVTATTQLALQTKPDYAIAVIPIPSQANNVLVMGKSVCEIHTNIGGIQNYRRNSTVNVDFGCLSVATIASSDKFIVWLGSNQNNEPVIMVYNGQSASNISTDGINYVLAKLRFPEQSTAFFYKQDGHLFYQLTFYNRADNLTLMYDFNTEKFYHLTDQDENYHPAIDAVYFNLRTYFLSLNNGALYLTSTELYSYDENLVGVNSNQYDPSLVHDIPRTRICESVRREDSARFIANSFVFTMNQGDDPKVTGLSIASAYPNAIITEDSFAPPNVDVVTENGITIVAEQNTGIPSDIQPYLIPTDLVYRPRVDMTISKDSGITFGSTVSRNLNPIGKRENIITFGNLGRANDLTIKLRFWGIGNFVIANGVLQVY